MTKRTVKSRKTTMMNEKTGEIRNVIVYSDGTKYFDLGCASVPVKDESWIEEPNGSTFQFWCKLSAFMIVAAVLTALEVYAL